MLEKIILALFFLCAICLAFSYIKKAEKNCYESRKTDDQRNKDWKK